MRSHNQNCKMVKQYAINFFWQTKIISYGKKKHVKKILKIESVKNFYS